jgi:hypothetical protein
MGWVPKRSFQSDAHVPKCTIADIWQDLREVASAAVQHPLSRRTGVSSSGVLQRIWNTPGSRTTPAGGRFGLTPVRGLLDRFGRRRVACSDILALAPAKSMTPGRRLKTTGSSGAIQGPVLFDEQGHVLEDMVSRGARLWNLGRHAGRSEQLLVVRACELRTACRDDVGGTMSSCVDLQEFLTWLPLCGSDKWSDRATLCTLS